MQNKFTLVSAAFILLAIGACKKSNSGGGSGPGSDPLTGNWNFTSMTSNATISASETLGPFTTKIIDVVDFTTKNNVGAFAFTADSLAVNGLGYTIDTTYTTYTYVGTTGDTVVSPITTTVAPASSTEAYTLVGSDSISFPGATPFTVGLSTGQSVQINGAHFAISGTTLTLTSTINQTGSETYGGITAPTTTQAKTIITLTKQ
jgi:hypothetical protein